MKIPSYPKIYNLGHKAIEDLFKDPVIVQEKYDGSQLSWMYDVDGLYVRSKGKQQYWPGMAIEDVDKGFVGAVEHLLSVSVPDTDHISGPYPIYRGEWFKGPRQNTLTYDNRPRNGLVLYDVEIADQSFVPPELLFEWAEMLGIDAAVWFLVPGEITLAGLEELLKRESSLGGPNVEGVVIKNYYRFGRDGKVLMGKLVSEAFREKHTRSWKQRNPNQGDVLDSIIEALNTEARWEKAIQHLRDDGLIEGSPKDIGPMMKEIKRDVLDEEREWIIDQLMKHFEPKITRAVGRGAPEWYKQKLAEGQFDGS